MFVLMALVLPLLPACSQVTTQGRNVRYIPVARGVRVSVDAGSSFMATATVARGAEGTLAGARSTDGTTTPGPIEVLTSPYQLTAVGSFPPNGVVTSIRVAPPHGSGSAPVIADFDPVTRS